jgi:carbonic anhydrase/acetyltransferase-like protein (isoleucine patch superfamily)
VGEGAVVGKNALVTAGSVVAPGTKIPAGEVRVDLCEYRY